MTRLLITALLASALLFGCTLETVDTAQIPQEVDVAIPFDGYFADGEFRVSVRPLDVEAMTPGDIAAVQQALTELMNVSDGVYGSGPPNTIELPTLLSGCEDGDTMDGNSCGAFTTAGCGTVPTGSAACLWADVELRHFFSGYLGNAYVNIESITPAVGVAADYAAYDDTNTDVFGLSSTLGLWRYGTLEPAGQAYDDGSRRWRFRLPAGFTTFNFSGKIYATVQTGGNSAPHIVTAANGDVLPSSTQRAFVSRDGSFTVFERNGQIYRADRLTGAVAQIATGTNLRLARLDFFITYERGGNVYRKTLSSGLESAVHVASGCTSKQPVPSSNARYVVFASDCTSLCGGPNTATGCVAGRFQIYRRDMTVSNAFVTVSARNGTTTTFAGAGSGDPTKSNSSDASISDNGNVVAFHSDASNLVVGDSINPDVFVRTISTNTTVRASRSQYTTREPAISPNGAFVVYASTDSMGLPDTNSTFDLFRYTISSGVNDIVSVNSAGVQASGASNNPSVTDCAIAFRSRAVLSPNDTNGSQADVYVRDLCGGQTEIVSINGDGGASNSASLEAYLASPSGGNTYVSFVSSARTLSADGASSFPTAGSRTHPYVVRAP